MIDFHSQLSIIPTVYESAVLQDNLEHSGGVTISWKSKESTEIPLGSYVTYSGVRYVLLEPYAPVRQDKIHCKYDVTFRHPQGLLDRTPFWIRTKDSSGTDIDLRTTSFTGYPVTIAEKLCAFFSEYVTRTNDTFFRDAVGTNWKYDIKFTVDGSGRVLESSHTIITVAFDSCSIKSAATAIADAMGCNVFFDWSTKTIRFIAGTTISGESYNCFHVLGGTRNMGKRTVSGSFAAVTQRLTLKNTYPGSQATYDENLNIIPANNITGIRLTKDLIFDDIYPKQELYIRSVHERVCYLTDEKGDFIVDYYSGGKPIFKTYAKWYVTLKYKNGTMFVFDRGTMIDDQPLSLLFQIDYNDTTNMSSLVGRQFELTHFTGNTLEKDKTDAAAPYDGTAGPGVTAQKDWFRIASVAVNDTILPARSDVGMCPKVGDKVTLVNVALGSQVVSDAQDELEAAAGEIIKCMLTPAGEYTETMFLKNGASVQIGGQSPFGEGHGPIVTSINHNLDTDVAEVTVGSWSRKTRTGGMADKIETVTVSANATTTGGDAYSNGVVTGGASNSSDKQYLITQTQVKPDTLFTAYLNKVMDTVKCDYEGYPNEDTNIYFRISAFYGTTNVNNACHIKLVFNNLNVYQGTANGFTPTDANKIRSNTMYDMTTDTWICVKVLKAVKMPVNTDSIQIPILVEHDRHGDRDLTFEIHAIRPGENIIRLDLDNEADMLAVDSEGYVRFDRTITTNARIYDGGNVATEGVEFIGTISDLQNAWKIGGCVPTITLTNGIGTISWAFTSAHKITSGVSIPIQMKYTKDGVTRPYLATFSLGVLDTDAIYQLSPRPDAVNFTRNNDNTLSPDVDVNLLLVKYDGTSTTEIGGSPTNYKVTYKYDETPTSSDTTWPATNGLYTKLTVANTTTNKDLYVALFYKKDANTWVMIDHETIPIVKDGKHGMNTVRLDIDNEMDMVPTDSTGKVTETRTIQTVVTLYDGASKVSITNPTVDAISYKDKNGTTKTLSPVITPGGSSTAKTLSWTFEKEWTITSYEIAIKYSYQSTEYPYTSVEYKAVFTIKASMGQPIWQLKPKMSSIPFQRGTDNSLTPADRTVDLSIVKIDGLSTSEYTSQQAGVVVIFSTESMPTTSTPDTTHKLWTSNTATPIKVTNDKENLYLALFNIYNVLIDRETVPVVKDGKDGESTVRVDLDNENDSMLYDGAGNILSGNVTSTAYLFDGPVDKSTFATWAISASGCTLSSASTSRNITVSAMTASTGRVTAQATYTDAHGNPHVKSAVLTIKKLVGVDKYDLVISPNALSLNTSEGWSASKVLSVKVTRIPANGGTPAYVNPADYSLALSAKLSGGTAITLGGSGANRTVTVTQKQAEDNENVTITLYKSGDTTAVHDSETIPFNKNKNSVRMDIDNEMDSIQYQGNGVTKVTSSAQVQTRVSLFDGTDDKSSDVTFYVDTDNTTIDSANYSLSGRLLTVTALHKTGASGYKARDGYVTVYCNYSDVVYKAKFSVMALVNQDKYDLDVNPNALFLNKSEGWSSSKTVTVKVMRTPAGGGTPAAINPEDYGLALSSTHGNLSLYDTTNNQFTLTVTQKNATDYNDTVLTLYKNGDTTKVYDRETIPFNKAENGTSPWIADLDNEMDSVACDVNGKPTSTQTVSTKVSMFYGSSKKAFSVGVYKDAACTQAYTNSSTLSSGIAVWWTSGSSDSNTINVKVSNALTINGKLTVYIKLTPTDQTSEWRLLNFTINGVRPGTNGDPATIYSLVPSCSEIAKKNGSTIPSGNVTCSVTKTTGTGSPQTVTTGFALVTKVDGTTQSSSTVSAASVTSNITYELYVPNSSGTLVDKETIPVVADGYGIVLTLTRDSRYTEANWDTYAAIGHEESFSKKDWDTDFLKCRIDDYFMVNGISKDAKIFHSAIYKCSSVASDRIGGVCVSHTRDGVDGEGVEYIYLLTKDSFSPIIGSGGASGHDDPTKDEYWPNVANYSAGKIYNNSQYWSDDPPASVSATWPVLWWAKRQFKKDSTTGKGVWGSFGDVTIHNNYSTSPWIADLDNEMDSIACDINGHPMASSTLTVQTTLSMFYGSTKKNFKITAVTINGSTSKTGVTLSYPTTASTSITFKATYAAGTSGATISGKDDIAITIQPSDATSETRTLHFTINGVKPGAKGGDAIIYKLVPSCSEVVKKKDGTYSVNNVSCTRQKNVGGTTTNNTTDGSITYKLDGGSEQSYTNNTNIAVTNFSTSIQFIFKVNSVIVDQETIPLVVDGNDGKQGKYEVKEYGRSKSNTSHADSDMDVLSGGETRWQPVAPSTTTTYPYIWQRTRTYDPATSTYGTWSYVCLTAQQGQAGQNGKWYRYAGVWGTDTSSVTNTSEVGWYVKYSDKFWMNVKADGTANTTNPGTGVAGWTEMNSSFDYYITKAVFSDQAYLGSFIINKDWLISTQGTQGTYSDFNATNFFNYITGTSQSYSGFIPNYAVDGKTGVTYQNNAYIKGNIVANSGTFNGTVNATGGSITGTMSVTGTLNVTGSFNVKGSGDVYIGNTSDNDYIQMYRLDIGDNKYGSIIESFKGSTRLYRLGYNDEFVRQAGLNHDAALTFGGVSNGTFIGKNHIRVIKGTSAFGSLSIGNGYFCIYSNCWPTSSQVGTGEVYKDGSYLRVK